MYEYYWLYNFIISFIGVYIGKIFGSKYEHKAEIAGGIILIVIGLKDFIRTSRNIFKGEKVMTNVFVSLLVLIVGFILLMKRSGFLCEGSSSIATRFHIPSLIIGLTIVAMGTKFT